jgi:hypothetical protein
MGASGAQGFYISHPMPPDALLAQLNISAMRLSGSEHLVLRTSAQAISRR